MSAFYGHDVTKDEICQRDNFGAKLIKTVIDFSVVFMKTINNLVKSIWNQKKP